MIIRAFGSTYSSAYQLPIFAENDDWQITRPPVTARVGGMGGVFNFNGTNNAPVGPLLIRKAFNQTALGVVVTGTGTLDGETNPPLVLVGDSTLFTTEALAGDVITDGGAKTFTVITANDNTHVAVAGTSGVTTGAYTITYHNLTATRLDNAIDALIRATIAAGEDKLWALRRDGVKRWCWATCSMLDPSEKKSNYQHVPITIEFFAREGLWYAENATTTTADLTGGTITVQQPTNNGTYPATATLTITSSAGTLTGFTVTNSTNGDTYTWTGSAGAGVAVVVNSGAYTVTKGGVGNYAGLTPGANQINWLRLNPGSNNLSITSTGSTAWAATLVYYDTYL